MAGFDILSLILNITKAAPIVVLGVEQIAKDASGANKKQLAMEALGLATYTASQIASQNLTEINVIGQLASSFIDNIVATFNAIGTFNHSNTTTATPLNPQAVVK